MIVRNVFIWYAFWSFAQKSIIFMTFLFRFYSNLIQNVWKGFQVTLKLFLLRYQILLGIHQVHLIEPLLHFHLCWSTSFFRWSAKKGIKKVKKSFFVQKTEKKLKELTFQFLPYLGNNIFPEEIFVSISVGFVGEDVNKWVGDKRSIKNTVYQWITSADDTWAQTFHGFLS